MSISSSFSSYAVPSLLTTKGDILTHNGTTLARVGVGSNGQALISDSSTTSGVAWSTAPVGSLNYYAPISYTTISANTGTVSITGIPNTYKTLGIIAITRDTSANQRDIFIRFNSSTTGYSWVTRYEVGLAGNNGNNPDSKITADFCGSDTTSSQRGYFHTIINQYANTSMVKNALFYGGGGQTTTRALCFHGHYCWNDTSAISSVQFAVDFGNTNSRIESGSVFYVYGLK